MMMSSWVIKHKKTGEMFSNFDSQDKVVWNSDDPWLYPRECDALFVMYHVDELLEVSLVEPFIKQN